MPIQVIDRQSPNLMVYFGSIKGEPEFHDTFKRLGYSVVYFLDAQTSWFSQFEFGKSFSESAAYLRETIESLEPSRVMFSGLSMGGFGAIWYANALKPDKVVVFSPQVDLTHAHAATYLGKTIHHKTPNLYTMIKRTYNTPTDLHVGMKENGAIFWDDIHHARLLKHLPCVNVIRHTELFSHNSARYIKTSGKLEETFKIV